MIVGFLILLTAITALKTQREHRVIVWSATLALALLPVQVILGRLTVTALLEPVIVTSHLGIATLIVLSLMTTTVATWFRAKNELGEAV
jgi:cytochrome c oxidase assembly protein subunit 15